MIYILTAQGYNQMEELARIDELSSSQYLTLNILRQTNSAEGLSTEGLNRGWGDKVKQLVSQGLLTTDYPEVSLEGRGSSSFSEAMDRGEIDYTKDYEDKDPLDWLYES